MKTLSIILCFSALLTGCSATKDDKSLLPDSGASTAELINGGMSQQQSYYGDNTRMPFIGKPIISGYEPSSDYSNRHLQELNRDFMMVPNPQIIMYVYPHLNDNRIPIPGYYTSFRLYEKNHYALTSEGYHE